MTKRTLATFALAALLLGSASVSFAENVYSGDSDASARYVSYDNNEHHRGHGDHHMTRRGCGSHGEMRGHAMHDSHDMQAHHDAMHRDGGRHCPRW